MVAKASSEARPLKTELDPDPITQQAREELLKAMDGADPDVLHAAAQLVFTSRRSPSGAQIVALAANINASMLVLGDAMEKAPAPLYPAHARAAQAAENLWRAIEAEFGLLTATEVGHLLGSQSASAARNLAGQRRRDGLLLGVERGRGVLYPGFQFNRERGEALPVVAELRRLGEKYGYNEATIIQWLCGPTTYLDDGDGARRPVDLLAADPDRVVAVARGAWGVSW